MVAGDLRRWDDECVEELCDIVIGQWMLGNFAIGVPREPLWDVITNTLNARTGKDFRKRQVMRQFKTIRREYCFAHEVDYGRRQRRG
nr:hypothetical protein CFP56_14509 [Quercus suber]